MTEGKLNVPLPCDEAPNKQILLQTIRIYLLQLHNTVSTCEILVQQGGAVVSNVIANCRDSLVAYWKKAMTQTLPVATYLHTINPIKHSHFCTQCDQGGSQKERFSHLPVLNFTMVGQYLTIKSVRFWQLHFISIWQLTGLLTVKLSSVRLGWS